MSPVTDGRDDFTRTCAQDRRRALATAEGRLVGTVGHEAARRYLLERLAKIGLQPYLSDSFDLPYTGGYEFHNLVGIVRGRTSGMAPVLIGAHYDSALDAPSADDNAAAVAIALAAAERLLAAPPARDVVVALFDAEEAPYYWTDDMVFRTHGVPYLFLSCGQWAHYHQPTDTPDRLNYVKMTRICEFLVALVSS